MADLQPSSSIAAVDAVIDEVLGGDLNLPQREQMIDETAYQFIGAMRDQAGESLDAGLAEGLNKLIPISPAEKGARVVPLLQQMLQVLTCVCIDGPVSFVVVQCVS